MRKTFFTLGLVALLVLPVLAQRQRGGFGRFVIDGTMLLGNEGVQKELKLSDDQRKDLKTANEAFRKAAQQAREDKDQEAGQKAREEEKFGGKGMPFESPGFGKDKGPKRKDKKSKKADF